MSEQKTCLLGRKKQRWEKNERGLFFLPPNSQNCIFFPFFVKDTLENYLFH